MSSSLTSICCPGCPSKRVDPISRIAYLISHNERAPTFPRFSFAEQQGGGAPSPRSVRYPTCRFMSLPWHALRPDLHRSPPISTFLWFQTDGSEVRFVRREHHLAREQRPSRQTRPILGWRRLAFPAKPGQTSATLPVAVSDVDFFLM